ncbi:transposase [Leptolyngbyaceae cyanobacterium CCMR0082]|uniref:Transposase n=1 Tax=Adonisia turfae CCMR0082 TaxID=2304604 RepID=A0A6M0SB28_9CYAN|nr:transposase [Adonisia turfae]NEZ65650.1 transposase [Adonisia turfae CCMR0082]
MSAAATFSPKKKYALHYAEGNVVYGAWKPKLSAWVKYGDRRKKAPDLLPEPIKVDPLLAKVKRFSVRLTAEQTALFDDWCERLRTLWNEALELLIEYTEFSGIDGAPCCPVPWSYRWAKDKNDKWISVPYSKFAMRRNGGRQCCPVPRYYKEPRLDQPSLYSLQQYFGKKRLPKNHSIQPIPILIARARLADLATAWGRCKGGERNRPKFQGKGDTPTSIAILDGKQVQHGASWVKIPKLGKISVPGLHKKWGVRPILTMSLVKVGNRFELHLAGNFHQKKRKPSRPKASIKLIGVENILIEDDRGKRWEAISNPQHTVKDAFRIVRLQQILSRKQFLSNGWWTVKLKLKNAWRETTARKHSRYTKIASFLARTYSEITIENKAASTVSKPKPVVESVDPIKYGPNGAAKIARYNKRISGMAMKTFVAVLKRKCEEFGTIVVEPEIE